MGKNERHRSNSLWGRLVPARWRMGMRSIPVSEVFGLDRGLPIDRWYIEEFLRQEQTRITGRVLEVADNTYTTAFGQNVEASDVLHAEPGNPKATIVGDLSDPATLPEAVADCFICTQTFHVIYDVKRAIQGARRLLKPGGTLLATLPGISQISRYDMDRWGDYWRFTDASARKLFGEVFGPENVSVKTCGNVLSSCAFLHGLAASELKTHQLARHDPNYQLLITVKGIKTENQQA